MSEIIMMPACRVRGQFSLNGKQVVNPLISLRKGDVVRYREGDRELRFRSNGMRVNGPQGSDAPVPLEGPFEIVCYKGDPATNSLGDAEVQTIPTLLAGVSQARLLVYALALSVVTGVVESQEGQDAVWTMV